VLDRVINRGLDLHARNVTDFPGAAAEESLKFSSDASPAFRR
jgi:hypothetical protein